MATHFKAAPSKFTSDINDFLTRYRLPNPQLFTPLPEDQLKIRIEHMYEEMRELVDSAQKKDWPEVLDALVDVSYIAIGTALMCGANFDEAWRRVHEANMAKIRASRDNLGKRETEFDVIKPKDWRPADLTDLVGEHHG